MDTWWFSPAPAAIQACNTTLTPKVPHIAEAAAALPEVGVAQVRRYHHGVHRFEDHRLKPVLLKPNSTPAPEARQSLAQGASLGSTDLTNLERCRRGTRNLKTRSAAPRLASRHPGDPIAHGLPD
jgi:hypothetical protein